jgi:hypothetical protein
MTFSRAQTWLIKRERESLKSYDATRVALHFDYNLVVIYKNINQIVTPVIQSHKEVT